MKIGHIAHSNVKSLLYLTQSFRLHRITWDNYAKNVHML